MTSEFSDRFMDFTLNNNAANVCRRMAEKAGRLRIAVHGGENGATVIDCGIAVPGGLEAGRLLAEVCMAGLGHVELVPGRADLWPGLAVSVRSDAPVAACLAAQYAGWRIQKGSYFAMGSGPMRAAAAKEPLFDRIGMREKPREAVGVLETGKLPPAEVAESIAADCGVEPTNLTLLVAPTASQAGTLQIAARSLETALHKLLELGSDVSRIESGHGIAPLPPVADDDMTAIGRTNDAILYGGEVTLWVRGDAADWEALGPKIPSSASPDFGEPFGEIFKRYKGDFYAIDPLLFSPAVVTINCLESGRTLRYGKLLPKVIQRSFGG